MQENLESFGSTEVSQSTEKKVDSKINFEAVKNNLNRIFGTDFKVKKFEGGLKVNVDTIDVTQMGELNDMYKSGTVSNIYAKRSGTGITVITEIL